MSGRRLILCLDPVRLLRPPCPALFPEWDRELLVITRGTSDEGWSRVASALAAAQSRSVRAEVWCLTDRDHWSTRAADIVSLCESAPSPLKTQLLNPTRVLLWLKHLADHDGAGEGAVMLRTRFEASAPRQAGTLEQLRLLPLAIRVLLDREVLLAALGHSTRTIQEVNVITNGDVLPQAELSWKRRLVEATSRLQEEQERLETKPCTEELFDEETFASLKTELKLEEVAPLTLSLFQTLHVDEKEIKDWFENERSEIERAAAEHKRALAEGFADAISRLAGAKPTKRASETCRAEREKLRSELDGDDRAQRSEEQQASATRRVQAWLTTHRGDVLTAAGRRATARPFAAAVVLAMVTCAVAAAVGFASPTPASASWRDVLPAVVVMEASVLLVSLAAAVVYWHFARRAVRVALDGLIDRRGEVRKEAEAATSDAEWRIRRMVQFRNLAALDRACEEQRARHAQIRVHADAVQALSQTVQGKVGEAREDCGEIDSRKSIEEVEAYWWRGGTGTELVDLFLGKHAMNGVPGNLHDTLRRYAGVTRIELR